MCEDFKSKLIALSKLKLNFELIEDFDADVILPSSPSFSL